MRRRFQIKLQRLSTASRNSEHKLVIFEGRTEVGARLAAMTWVYDLPTTLPSDEWRITGIQPMGED